MNKIVSVVITTYKADDINSVKKAIASVQYQTYKNIEIIVVNNNDVDDEYYNELKVELIKSPNIIVLETKKASSAQIARNLAIMNAHGKYIKFLDDDDFLFPSAIEELIKTLEISNTKMAHGNIKINKIGLKNKLVGFMFRWIMRILRVILYSKYNNQHEWFLCYSNYYKNPSTLSTIFERDFLMNNGMWNENYLRLQDNEIIARMLRVEKISHCNHLIGTYNSVAKHATPEFSRIIKISIYNYLTDNYDAIENMSMRNKLFVFIKYYIHNLDSDSKDLRNKIYNLFWSDTNEK